MKPKIKRLALGLAWAVIAGIAPAATAGVDDLMNWDEPTDWKHLGKVAFVGGLLGATAYLRKEKAEIEALFTPVPEIPQ